MEYHSDRFEDFSLLVFKDKKLVGVFPANKDGDEVHSHQGLSYGGLVMGKKEKMSAAAEMYKQLLQFLEAQGIKRLHIKLTPAHYHAVPSDEMEYLLFISEATVTRVDVSSVIVRDGGLKIQSNRLEGVKKAEKHGLTIEEGHGFENFWKEILEPNLAQRHDAKPVHSLEEIKRLAAHFPKNIRQFNVVKEGEIVAGATLFDTGVAVHVQYISGNADKQQLGSLDFLFDYLINERYKDKKHFDFGISNINNGRNINEGLLYWKETFGARSIACKFYSVDTAKYTKLDSIFI